MLSAVIIDDENDSIDTIISIIDLYDVNIKVIGRGNSVKEGTEVLGSCHPDLVFFDVRLGDELSFTILEHIKEPDFQIIFISGHDQYAINAFRYSAVDFLLKPVDPDEFVKAVKKVEEKILSKAFSYNHIKTLLSNLSAPRPFMLSVPTSDGLEFINIDDIININAEGSYSVLSFQNKTSMMVSKNIGELQEQLPKEEFCRAHNSYLINLKYVKKLRRKDGLAAEMTDGKVIPIARNKKDIFMKQIESFLIYK